MPQVTDIDWLDNLTPKSTRFDDTYYSRQNGLEETRYVFLDGNGLQQRWKDLSSPVIGELGFGTGLNFLATWLEAIQVLSEDKLNDQPLTFLSFEKYPMSADALLQALSRWPELEPFAAQLAAQWSPDQPGWQTFDFATARLFLFIGDADHGIDEMPHKVDAWYLDGFNPKTNADLWSAELMKKLAAGSNPQATLASYTAAGWVRRNLQDAGFEIAKRKGFGHKRDMITGRLV